MWLLYLIGRLALASFEQALRVRLSHQTEFDKRDNLTLLHMGLCLTAFGLFIFPMSEWTSQNAIKTKNPQHKVLGIFHFIRRLAMTYSHMGRPHTTIGAI
ncbi:hypothetical protein, partial [Shewanella algae]|uniref:hypothetical protein n=1 Tax=Shewanella algae TaxID=38313 RepID=UPI002553C35C